MTNTTKRPIDQIDVNMYQLGFKTALEMAVSIARQDRRVSLAKDCGYVPGWQKGRWSVADELMAHLKAAALGETSDGKEG